MEGQRVNRISARSEGNGVILTMYRTHKKLAELTNRDLGIEDYKESKTVTKQMFIIHCREALINLLQNGGVQGYYYDPENHSNYADIPKKYDRQLFGNHAVTTVEKLIVDLCGLAPESIATTRVNPEPVIKITETYSDGHIKYGTATCMVEITRVDGYHFDIEIPVNIRSGQMTNPKVFLADGIEHNLNITNIRKAVRFEELTKSESTTEGKPVIIIQKPEEVMTHDEAQA